MPSTLRSSLLLCCVFLLGCIKDGAFKTEINYLPQPSLNDWETAPVNQYFDEAAIKQVYEHFFDEEQFVLGTSLLIIKDGLLITEGYSRNLEDATRIENIKSATKSVTSLLVGIALKEGFIDSTEQTLGELLPDYPLPEEKAAITLHQLLSMTSGLEWSNTSNTWPLMTGVKESSLEQVLERDLEFDPGTDFHYTDGQPQVVAAIVQEHSQMSLASFAGHYLFAPLGIDDFYWEQHPDGVHYGAVALYLRPRDFAKIGCFALQNGFWEGQQVLPADWMERSTQAHAISSFGREYGYYW